MKLKLLVTLAVVYFEIQQKKEQVFVQAGIIGGDAKKYSYVCLRARPDLCLGISPGKREPFYDPKNIFDVQVKSRLNNEFSGDDYKKTRWDLDYDTGKVFLSRFDDLCMARLAGDNDLILTRCKLLENATPQQDFGIWDLRFQDNELYTGTLELKGLPARQCATVMECQSEGKDFCNPRSEDIAESGGMSKGSFVKLKPCYDDPIWGNPNHEIAQVWTQRLDCAVGCNPFLQNNDECDAVCDVKECGFEEACRSAAPTPPTPKPVRAPTVRPTAFPTLEPTVKPTLSPTARPTTVSPTTSNPTTEVTSSPTLLPTMTPTTYPTFDCPTQEKFELCARYNRGKCITDPIAKANCAFCFDQCVPRDDVRACQIRGFYDHCLPKCPSYDQVNKCPLLSAKKCRGTSFGRANCSVCNGVCFPGTHRGICLKSATFYQHCEKPKAPCPDVLSLINCESRKMSKTCTSPIGGKKMCTWCASTEKCMPGTRPEVCNATMPYIYDYCDTTTKSPTFPIVGGPPTSGTGSKVCPSVSAFQECRKFSLYKYKDDCEASPNCLWCSKFGCVAGKDSRACLDKDYYDTCKKN